MVEWKNNRFAKNLLILMVYLIIFIILIILEIGTRHALFNPSIRTIQNYQQDESESKISFFKFISELGDQRTFFIIALLLFSLLSRQTSFYLQCCLQINLIIQSFLKMILQDGRPFMMNLKIFPYICELTFANPSSQCLNTVSFLLVISLYIFEQIKTRRFYLTPLRSFFLCCSSVIAMTFLILISLQGLFNGNNFIDQVLFGIELGILIACFSHFYLRKIVDKHITNLLDGIYVHQYKPLIMWASLIYISVLLFITLIYLIANHTFVTPDYWVAQIQMKCPGSPQLTELVFQDANFVSIGLLFNILGSYFGMILDAFYFKGTQRRVNQTPIKKTLIRLLVSIVIIFSLFVLPVIFISDDNSVFTVFFLKYAIPSFVSSFILFGFSKKVFQIWNLVNEAETTQEPALIDIQDSQRILTIQGQKKKNKDSSVGINNNTF